MDSWMVEQYSSVTFAAGASGLLLFVVGASGVHTAEWGPGFQCQCCVATWLFGQDQLMTLQAHLHMSTADERTVLPML